jgi:hypothetical protein
MLRIEEFKSIKSGKANISKCGVGVENGIFLEFNSKINRKTALRIRPRIYSQSDNGEPATKRWPAVKKQIIFKKIEMPRVDMNVSLE